MQRPDRRSANEAAERAAGAGAAGPARDDLAEAAQRVRRYAGLAHAKHHRPLVVIVTKYDCWSSLLNREPLAPPWVAAANSALSALKTDVVEQISDRVRALLWQLITELVAAAEGFAENVIYIPVSATGARARDRSADRGLWHSPPRTSLAMGRGAAAVRAGALYVRHHSALRSGRQPPPGDAAPPRRRVPPPRRPPCRRPPAAAPGRLSGEFTLSPPAPGRGPVIFEGEQPLPSGGASCELRAGLHVGRPAGCDPAARVFAWS